MGNMASAFNCVVVGFQALRKIPRISAVLDSAVDFSPGSPADVQTIRAALALATVIEASLGCLGPSAEYVSRALTIENPEVAPITRLIQDNVQPGSNADMRTGLQTLGKKIAQSGLQPVEYLTAGLAGSLLPARALEIATLWHTRGILIATVKAKHWEQPAAQLGVHDIAHGCLPPFVSRATQNIHPVVAGLLGVLSTEIMFEWLSRGPHPQHTWRLFNAVFPGVELALRKYRKGAYSPSASSQPPACNRAGFELGAQAIARGIRACSAEAEHRGMTLQQIVEEKVRPYKGPGMQYHIAVLMDGTMRVASALLDQPMEPSGSIAGSSSGGAFRQPEQAAASQAAAIEPEGASLTLPGNAQKRGAKPKYIIR